MASNYEKEPFFLLENTWDDLTKLPEKYKFQGPVNKQKGAVCIDSGTLGMEFFLNRSLPQFNQAGTKLDCKFQLPGLSVSIGDGTHASITYSAVF